LHTLCNSGQDTLSLAARGARAVGVDLSDEAIAFARELSATSGIGATFHESEVLSFLEGPSEREPFDVVYGSYGCLPWIDDLSRYFAAVASRLAPRGRVVILDFHPMAWSFDERFALRDPYFAPGHVFSDPVSDYVGAAGGALSPSGHMPAVAPYENPHEAHAYQHTVADLVTAAIGAGLVVESLREWPYANGCRVCAGLVPRPGDERRFTTPPGTPTIPLMLGFTAKKA
jgi:SAM-dependent methyltransferase